LRFVDIIKIKALSERSHWVIYIGMGLNDIRHKRRKHCSWCSCNIIKRYLTIIGFSLFRVESSASDLRPFVRIKKAFEKTRILCFLKRERFYEK